MTTRPTTSKLRVTVQDDGGRAKILLMDGPTPVGMASVPWTTYRQLVTSITGFVTIEARAHVARHLAESIWRDAVIACKEDAERAMRLLEDIGWTQSTVDRYADEISRRLLDALLERLPGEMR